MSKFAPSPKLDRLMELVGRLALSTAWQLNDALFSEGTRTTTATALKALEVNGYLEVEYLKEHPRGKAKNVYKLSTKGYTYLTRTLGIVASELVKPSDLTVSKYRSLKHALDSNQPIIKAMQLTREYPDITHEFRGGTLLRHDERKRAYADGEEELKAIPDAFIRFFRPPKGAFTFWMEVDRATENKPALTSKLQKLINLDGSPDYAKAFGTDQLIVVFIVTEGGEARRDYLLSITEELLESVGAKKQADLFRFGVMGTDLYFGTSFCVPFEKRSFMLLPFEWRAK